jgi:hypothetical protein
VRAGRSYVDVGTLHGYREAIRLLSSTPQQTTVDGMERGPSGKRLAGAILDTFAEPRSKRLRAETNGKPELR